MHRVPAAAKAPAAGTGAPRPRRTVEVGQSAGASAAVPLRDTPPEGKDRLFSGRAIAATAAAAVLVVGGLFLTGVIGGSDSPTKPEQAATTISTETGAAPAAGGDAAIPSPADTTIAVLNGTTVTGLARQAADKLLAEGYDVPKVTDAADQAQQASAVAFADGFRGSARQVARIIGIPSSQIVPIDASTRAVAGDQASVVVTMGADKAQGAGQAQ
jgi:hypothetical protein